MSSVDSKAVFSKRAAQLGLSHLLPALGAQMWDTYGNFAFAVPVAASGVCDPGAFHDQVVTPIFGLTTGDPVPPAAAILRRLFVESHTLWLQDLKHKGERTDADPPRRLPQVEREARRGELAKRLAPAIVLDGEYEPAHGVVDRFISMVEDDRIEHIPWGSVATRRAEVKHGPARRKAATDEKSARDVLLPAEASTRHEIHLALTRRGVAADMAGLMSFEAHELIRARFMCALTEGTGDPAYAPPSVARVAAADSWLWEKLSAKCARGVGAPTAADPLPADAAVRELLLDYDFALRLAPLPTGTLAKRPSVDAPAGDRAHKTPRGGRGADAAQKTIARLERELAAARATAGPPGDFGPPVGKGSGRNNGGKGNKSRKGGGASDPSRQGRAKDKNKDGKPRSAWVPTELQPGVGCDLDGNPLCFRYNLGQCDAASHGQRCSRGLHLCTKVGCQGPHPATDCPL